MTGPLTTAVLLLELSAAPGSLLWEAKVPPRDLVGMAEVQGVVVTGSQTGDGGAFAFDGATGKPLWRKRGEQVPEIPAADGRRVYMMFGGAATRRLAALDPRTGRQLWSVPGSYKMASAGGPLTDGERVYLLNGDGTLTAHDAVSGRQVWSLTWGGDDPECPTGLALHDGLLAFGGGRHWMGKSKGRPKALWAVDAATGKERWQTPLELERNAEGGQCLTTPVIADGTVVTTAQHVVFGLDAASGAVRWSGYVKRERGGYPRWMRLSQVAVSRGVVFAVFDEGIASWSLARGAQFPELPGTMDPNSQVHRMKELDGVLYFVGLLAGEDPSLKYILHALDVSTGRVLWRHRTSRPKKFMEDWRTTEVLPTPGGVYYENAQLLAKVTR